MIFVIYTQHVNKTWALLQTIGGKDEPHIALMRKWEGNNYNNKTKRENINRFHQKIFLRIAK